mmetsp:Transcript_17109/g.51064  ORF Transcript_17109/g.51064 Transcript_17109/m.51064 type:complete len:266 (-) Transcript_17109:6-803(-)
MDRRVRDQLRLEQLRRPLWRGRPGAQVRALLVRERQGGRAQEDAAARGQERRLRLHGRRRHEHVLGQAERQRAQPVLPPAHGVREPLRHVPALLRRRAEEVHDRHVRQLGRPGRVRQEEVDGGADGVDGRREVPAPRQGAGGGLQLRRARGGRGAAPQGADGRLQEARRRGGPREEGRGPGREGEHEAKVRRAAPQAHGQVPPDDPPGERSAAGVLREHHEGGRAEEGGGAGRRRGRGRGRGRRGPGRERRALKLLSLLFKCALL